MAAVSPKIKNGRVIVYRVFDIAEEVDLHHVERILSTWNEKSRLELKMKGQEAVIIRNAPVRFQLGQTKIEGLDETFVGTPFLIGTVWDYGSLSLAFHFPLGTERPMEDLFQYSNLFNNDLNTISALNNFAKAKTQELVSTFAPALQKPKIWQNFEDYIIYFAENVGEDLENVRDHLIPELLLGEPSERLSKDIRQVILDNAYQFEKDDLCVVDWNSAFVVEPSGQSDVVDVLEFALTHLLEVRFYDELIDTRLNQLYDAVEQDRKRFPILKVFYSRFVNIAEEANTRYLELAEFTERMGNSLKVVGDFYLARIFRAAIQRFRVRDWEEGIVRKMDLLSKVPTLLQSEVNTRRGHLLEIVIILLILFEIVTFAR